MTPHFDCEPPRVELLSDGRNVRVVDRDIRFIDSRGITWIAPVGTETDGASIPRFLWPIIGGPFEGTHRDGAILHDAAYSLAPACDFSFWLADRSILRAAADQMLYEAARARKCSIWKARAINHGVRLGGAFAWKGHANENKKGQAGA